LSFVVVLGVRWINLRPERQASLPAKETGAMNMKKTAVVAFLVAASVIAFSLVAAASAVWGS
jgi:hypothetical protein